MTEQVVRDGFGDLYEPVPFSGCWLWTRGYDGNGYGSVRMDGKTDKGQISQIDTGSSWGWLV